MHKAVYHARYFLRTSIGGMRGSPVTCFVSMLTIGVTLLLIGVFLLFLQNMHSVLDRFGESLSIRVFLNDAVSSEEIARFRQRFASIEGVSKLQFVSKEEALQRFQGRVGMEADLLEGLGENPLPASFELQVEPAWRTRENLRELAGEIEGIPGIDEVSYGGQWAEAYARFINLAQGVSAALGGVLIFSALLIVANTIQLAIYARRDELEILSLVGASRMFANTPFLLEGMVQGLMGGLIALGLLYTAFLSLVPRFGGGWTFLLGNVPPRFLSGEVGLDLVLGGALLGFAGSALALATRKRA